MLAAAGVSVVGEGELGAAEIDEKLLIGRVVHRAAQGNLTLHRKHGGGDKGRAMAGATSVCRFPG